MFCTQHLGESKEEMVGNGTMLNCWVVFKEREIVFPCQKGFFLIYIHVFK